MMQVYISKTSITQTIHLLKAKFEDLSVDGCFFAIVNNEYDSEGNVTRDFLDIIHIGDSLGYKYINTIVYPSEKAVNQQINDNVNYVVWFCKDPKQMTFNKDFIREKHIWKDVEWGKRDKNYNPKGKDPGNVWIPTIDDGRANITNHILLNDQDVINKILAMTCCGENYELFCDDIEEETIKQQNIEPVADNGLFQNPRVVFGTSEHMNHIKPSSVSLVVTSPPYWNLKDYFKHGQIGQEDYDTYLGRMKQVWSECYDKLNDNGSLWININIRVQSGKTILIPHDFVTICKDLGFYYKGIIVWHKSSGIPTHDKNIVDRHEYVLIFSKSKSLRLNRDVFMSFSDYKNDKINGGAFWNINRKAGSVGKKFIHPAIYPNGLVERIVSAVTCECEFVLDPFLGSGTSLIASANLNRNFIGYEYNEGFKELMESRFEKEMPSSVRVDYITE